MNLALVERSEERLTLQERLTPLERLEVLTDPGSMQLLRTQVRSRRMGHRARAGDGVLAAHPRIDGRQVYCYAQDASFAFIAMNSKALGADYVFSWPDGEMGVMGAEQAVGVLNRREIVSADDPPAVARRLACAYAAEHLHAEAASADGFVDEVIPPDSTRRRIASCLEALAGVQRPVSGVGNIQL